MRIQPGYKSGDCKKFSESKNRLDLRSGRFFVSFIMKIFLLKVSSCDVYCAGVVLAFAVCFWQKKKNGCTRKRKSVVL